MLPFTVHPVGDCALLAGFTQRIAPEIGAAVAALNSRRWRLSAKSWGCCRRS